MKLNLILVLISFTFLIASDWPQFRGADQSHVIINQNLPETWSDSTNIRWVQSMEGESWSSPIISGYKVFYSSAVLLNKAPRPIKEEGQNQRRDQQDDNSYLKDVYRWQLVCLNLKNGKELWKAVSLEGNPRVKKNDGSTYACESPVTDGKRVYVYYGMHGVFCYDMDGNLMWQKDLGALETQNGWGTGSSPLLYKGVLYVLVDNEVESFFVALDTKTGDEKWRKNRDEKTTYSTPAIWENSVRTELVTLV